MSSKIELRRKALDRRQKVDNFKLSRKVSEYFLNSDFYKKNNSIMSYMSFKSEVDTIIINNQILKDNKVLILPIIKDNLINAHKSVNNEDFSPNRFGILEPVNFKEFNPKKINLILVPGIAFDLDGNRIGFGKGYYDKFLKDLNAITLGLCFDVQIVSKIPSEPHDIRLNGIISDSGIKIFD